MAVYQANATFKHAQPKFKVFYEDGTTYDNTSGSLDRITKKGVVVILMEDENDDTGQRFESGFDFYCYFTHGWVGVSQYGMYDYLSSSGTKLVLFGRVVNGEKRNDIFNAAMSDTHIKG